VYLCIYALSENKLKGRDTTVIIKSHHNFFKPRFLRLLNGSLDFLSDSESRDEALEGIFTMSRVSKLAIEHMQRKQSLSEPFKKEIIEVKVDQCFMKCSTVFEKHKDDADVMQELKGLIASLQEF